MSRILFDWRHAVLFAALLMGGCAPASGPCIELAVGHDSAQADADRSPVIVVTGLGEPELAALRRLNAQRVVEVLDVFVASELPHPLPIAGTTSLESGGLRFTPRYPLEPGLRYRAVLHRLTTDGTRRPAGDDLSVELQVPPRAARDATRVTHIYPSSGELPENQLKFYFQFSAPMGRGQAYQHIHLLDADEREVEGAFLELDEELWNRDQLRFTLLCDPGRVKRGLKPREELGGVLQAGRHYTLVLDDQWPDAKGQPLAETVRKTFDVAPPILTPLDPSAWKIEPPSADTREPLVVRLPQPLDHELLGSCLTVHEADGALVDGAITITDQERCWRFTPPKPWAAGDYHLVAQTILEDLAGNSIGRAFDVDLDDPAARRTDKATISLPFVVSPRAN
jgi:hypothetical protein